MKAKMYIFIAALSVFFYSKQVAAQTTAMNFSILDCAGNPHELYADLDAGKVVIIEFFMTSCGSCITAGNTLEALKSDLLVEYPGMVKSYAFGYTNSYSCATVSSWVTTNGFTSIPSDSGAAQVAYYGGFGMPTIVVLGGGTNHEVLGSPYIGFSSSDTTTMGSDIRDFLNGNVGIEDHHEALENLNIYPNPANGQVTISFDLSTSSDMAIEVTDLTGRIVLSVMNEKLISGTVVRTINTSGLAEGNYLIRINRNGEISHQKLAIVH